MKAKTPPKAASRGSLCLQPELKVEIYTGGVEKLAKLYPRCKLWHEAWARYQRHGTSPAGSVLEAFEQCTKVQVKRSDKDIVHVLVHLSTDDREALVTHLVKAGIGLRRLDDAEGELEEIFLNLMERAS